MTMNHRKIFNKALTTVTLLVAAIALTKSAHAIEYDVEMIIFENVRETRVGSSDTLLLPVIPDTQAIPDAPVPGADIQPLGELRLLSEVEKIRNSSSHHLLYHGGWRQGATDKETAPYMAISLGSTFNMLSEPGNEDSKFLRGYLSPPLDTELELIQTCLLYTSPSPRDRTRSRMPSSA